MGCRSDRSLSVDISTIKWLVFSSRRRRSCRCRFYRDVSLAREQWRLGSGEGTGEFFPLGVLEFSGQVFKTLPSYRQPRQTVGACWESWRASRDKALTARTKRTPPRLFVDLFSLRRSPYLPAFATFLPPCAGSNRFLEKLSLRNIAHSLCMLSETFGAPCALLANGVYPFVFPSSPPAPSFYHCVV